MISVREAHDCIAREIAVLPVDNLSLERARGQVLADDLFAPFQMPRFDNAAMDGFALQWEDIQHASDDSPVTLRVLEEIPAGRMPRCRVVSGTCAQIMTGAPLPEGADTVVMFEHTSGFGGSSVDIYKAPSARSNVRYSGEEVERGELLLEKGSKLTPAEIGVLAAFGTATVAVYRRPKLSVLTVGDELRDPGEILDGGAIYNSNRFSLTSCAVSAGAEITGHVQVPDDKKAIGEALEDALSSCDMLLAAGGISTGEYDYMQQMMTGLGVRQKFWKVAQKPGKPLFFGKVDRGPMVFALPGNPVSALVGFLEYCMPTLAAMQCSPYHGKIEAELTGPFPADKKRHRFLFGKLWQNRGKLFCSISPKIESHMITSLLGANCLIEAPPAPRSLPGGTAVTCNLLPWSTLNH